MARMGQLEVALLEYLDVLQRDLREAQAVLQRQLKNCIAAGCTSVQIAERLGCEPGTVRKMRAWKERRR